MSKLLANLLDAEARLRWAYARRCAVLDQPSWQRKPGELARVCQEEAEARRVVLIWKRAMLEPRRHKIENPSRTPV